MVVVENCLFLRIFLEFKVDSYYQTKSNDLTLKNEAARDKTDKMEEKA